jgi:hypothetical protein
MNTKFSDIINALLGAKKDLTISDWSHFLTTDEDEILRWKTGLAFPTSRQLSHIISYLKRFKDDGDIQNSLLAFWTIADSPIKDLVDSNPKLLPLNRQEQTLGDYLATEVKTNFNFELHNVPSVNKFWALNLSTKLLRAIQAVSKEDKKLCDKNVTEEDFKRLLRSL